MHFVGPRPILETVPIEDKQFQSCFPIRGCVVPLKWKNSNIKLSISREHNCLLCTTKSLTGKEHLPSKCYRSDSPVCLEVH